MPVEIHTDPNEHDSDMGAVFVEGRAVQKRKNAKKIRNLVRNA